MYDHRCRHRFSGALGCALIGSVVALSGCAPQHKDAILFGVNTQVGLKVGVDERQVPTAILGYNRQEAALVPLLVYGDGIFKAAHRNLDTTTYLQLARDRFEKAENPAEKEKERLFTEGTKLVTLAYAAASQKSSETAETPVITPGLAELNALAQNPNITEVTKYKLIAEAEIARPSTATRFLAEYKYVADYDGSKYSDAYSVLGTFAGSAKGTAKPATGGGGVEATGSIAQYFATGIAAQNLSRTPAAVNTAASAAVAENVTKLPNLTKNPEGSALKSKLVDLNGTPDGKKRIDAAIVEISGSKQKNLDEFLKSEPSNDKLTELWKKVQVQ